MQLVQAEAAHIGGAPETQAMPGAQLVPGLPDYAGWSTRDVLRDLLCRVLPRRIALVSSFGAESVVLLHMAAVTNRHVPVLFIDTEMLFAETLTYQLEL